MTYNLISTIWNEFHKNQTINECLYFGDGHLKSVESRAYIFTATAWFDRVYSDSEKCHYYIIIYI